jgi:hypothetical protein
MCLWRNARTGRTETVISSNGPCWIFTLFEGASEIQRMSHWARPPRTRSATEVARRTGHGVAVLLKIYAQCIDGQADTANKWITDALGAQDAQPEPEPDDEGEDGSAQAS